MMTSEHKYFENKKKKSYRRVQFFFKKTVKHLKGTINPIAVKYLGKWACFL